MSTLIPAHAAGNILEGLTEYLTTSFSLADQETGEALKRFLGDADAGMFHGPYVRSRLPYAQARDWEGVLSWLPGYFVPYHHQAEAFRRLRSVDEHGERRPDPTLVVTGTGSGKTESFLYPILDHARRMRAQGQRGVKALLLYPMNALANDQADRLAQLLTEHPELEGVTAGIYTGESSGSGATKVSKKSLITNREKMRQDPPDLLLTNYKMLDQLLLRSNDREIWEHSAESLQYLVLDEFHTYDGAQGTDVALLLRRLGLQLKSHQSAGFLDAEATARPLGQVVPVATSATLGSDKAPGDGTNPMLEFAHTIFGERFPAHAIVSEKTLTIDQWREEIAATFGSSTLGADEKELPTVELIKEILDLVAEGDAADGYAERTFEVFCEKIWHCVPELKPAIANFADHELTAALLEHASTAVPMTHREQDQARTLPELVLGSTFRLLGEEKSREFLTHALTAIAYLRSSWGVKNKWGGKRLPGVETHLWVREVSRIDRAIAIPEDGQLFRWFDDGPAEETGEDNVPWLPACYCRSCGRAGWMTELEPGTDAPLMEGPAIRTGSLKNRERQRPLLDATSEYRDAIDAGRAVAGPRGTDGESAVLWLHTDTRELSTRTPRDEELEREQSIPVLAHYGPDADDFAGEQRCPSCGENDSIRFIGSSVATLLSVALSNLFGMPELDTEEKKTLIFTDSVQDAAHRAGFVQARSRAFALRTFTRRAVGDGEITLDQLPDRLMELADSHRSRYELLPPDLVDFDQFKSYWHPDATDSERREAFREARRRLSFDLVLEFGQRAHLTRSLALTGSLTISVDTPEAAALTAATEALNAVASPTLEMNNRALQLAWVQGVLEMTRLRGGVLHEWLHPYLRDDGNAYLLNRREARARGIPAFPRGGSPEFPRVGPQLTTAARRDSGTTPLGSPRGRFAIWTAKLLGLGTHDAATAVAKLFDELTRRHILDSTSTDSGGTIYGLSADRIRIGAEEEPCILECTICHSRIGVSTTVRDRLNGQPCFTPGCAGHQTALQVEDNYYRRLYSAREPRTVVAKEHTGLLDKKVRLQLEQSFRSSTTTAPNAPNVLVATPTLEMGIDIGDLSTVMLASLPTSVASYVQRVGRAGRLTGNSLVIALVRGRGITLPKLNQPLSVISGSVTPPVAFLSAVEILNRQFTAFLVDSIDTQAEIPELATAVDVFNQVPGEPALADIIIARVRAGIDDLLDSFISSLNGHVDGETVASLRSWASSEEVDSLIGKINVSRETWKNEQYDLHSRRGLLNERLDELSLRSDEHDRELKEEKRIVRASLRHVNYQLQSTVEGQHWIASMERFGLLPNFTLLDDSVELSVAVSKFNPQEMVFDTEAYSYSRGVSSALFELAPGATFYAQGIAATIDVVEIGHQGSAIEQWRMCPSCSYSAILLGENHAPGSCPECGSPGFADKGQIIDVVQMRKVSSEVEQTRAIISDNRDDRYSARFHQHVSFTVPDGGRGASWYLTEGFGVEHLRQVEIRWLNLGQGNGQKLPLSGGEMDAPLFRVCKHCGHLDSEAGSNTWHDHRPWCPQRNESEEDTVAFALGRTLRTQGVLLLIPDRFTSAADTLTVPSLIAAIKLGFKEVLGGDPTHLDVATVQVARQDGGSVDALLLHDKVPGGTGYLSQFTDPESVHNLLSRAWERVNSCECQNDHRLACPDCLLPYARGRSMEVTSRAAAEGALRAILLDASSPDENVDPTTTQWNIQESRPAPSEGSKLELRFRVLIRTALEARHATIVDRVFDGRPQLDITFPGGMRWRMSAEREYGYTRPDFFFEPLNGNHRSVGVFLDGKSAHISAAAFRVHSDIEKRTRLTNELDPVLPWNLTWKDLDSFGNPVTEEPAWVHPKAEALASKNPILDQVSLKLMKGSPVDLLLAYLAEPTKPDWSEYAHAMALHLFSHAPSRQDGHPVGTLMNQIQLRCIIGNKKLRAKELKLLTDGPDDLPEEVWNTFLTLANLMWLAPDDALVVSTNKTVMPPAQVVEEVEMGVDKHAAVAAGWEDAFEEFSDDAEVEKALRTLASAGVTPTDVLGAELESVATVLVWPQEKVVLLFEADDEADAVLVNKGWTALHADSLSADDIPTALLNS